MESKIAESASRGRIVVATKDYLAGELVLEETPIMLVPKEYVKRYEVMQFSLGYIVACCWWFTKRLRLEEKKKILTMCGPTSTSKEVVRTFRDFAQHASLYCFDDPASSGKLSSEQVETFVKLACIVKVNMFGLEKDSILYFQLSQFAHSCAPNCHYEYEYLQTTVRLRTTRVIQAGEEMTYSYLPKRDLQPTFVRRQAYLASKEFTCHCPRCDAPGDDTRQFDCFYTECKGVMMVCQPRTEADLIALHQTIHPDGRVEVDGPRYIGVDYVEPHLLPCTVCRCIAPAAYQAKMFTLEAKLLEVGESFKQREDMLLDTFDLQGYQHLHQEIKVLQAFHPLPRCHALAVPIWRVLMQIHKFYFLSSHLHGRRPSPQVVEQERAAVQRSAREFIAAQEAVMPVPHRVTADALWAVCNSCVTSWRQLCPYMFPPLEAKSLLQKALRMFLILNGRNERHKPPADSLDQALLAVLAELPSQAALSIDLCAFCEESSQRAAMKRSRCGDCKKVSYCSAGCQKAHWKLHKKTCKAPAP